MIIWFDEFGNRREQIYENGTLTAGSYAFDTLYVYWDNETNFISKPISQLNGCTADFVLSNGTSVAGVTMNVETLQIPLIKDYDFQFFKPYKTYRVLKATIPSGVLAVNGVVYASIKVRVGGTVVKTLDGVTFVVQGHTATNSNISDADYQYILANYMPYTGGAFTGNVTFSADAIFNDDALFSTIKIGSLSPIKKTTDAGDVDWLDFGTDNNILVSGSARFEGGLETTENASVDGNLYVGGNITDGSISFSVANVVDKTTEQTISGLKKFTTCPETSGAIYYNNNNQLTNKSYVDSQISAVNNAISAEAGARQLTDTYLSNQIGYINEKIPSQATSSNKLADKDWVNSTINSLAAFYITKNAAGDPFSTRAELMAATTFYSGGEVRVPTRNDYCLVNADETHDNASCRYIYQGGQWEFQFIVNETAFTATQLAALNSGINATLVGQITTNQNAITALDATKLAKTEAQSTYQKKNTVGDITLSVSDWVVDGTGYKIVVNAATGLSNPITIEDGDTFIYIGITASDKAQIGNNGVSCTSDETDNEFTIRAMSLPDAAIQYRILQIK